MRETVLRGYPVIYLYTYLIVAFLKTYLVLSKKIFTFKKRIFVHLPARNKTYSANKGFFSGENVKKSASSSMRKIIVIKRLS